MFCLSAEEQRALDAYAVARGLALASLMEAAGFQLYNWIQRAQEAGLLAPDVQVLIYCGRGNNAGDGYVLARYLAGGGYCWKLYEEDPGRAAHCGGLLAQVRQAALAQGQDLASWEEGLEWIRTCIQDLPGGGSGGCGRPIQSAKSQQPSQVPWPDLCIPQTVFWEGPPRRPGPLPLLIVDAVYGSGFSHERGLSSEAQALFGSWETLRQAGRAGVLAVDLPSGVSASTGELAPGAARADWTLSFVAPKTGILSAPGRAQAGDIYIGQIGLSQTLLQDFWQHWGHCDAAWQSLEELRQQRPNQSWKSNKFSQGRSLVYCGSSGMQGAAYLAIGAAQQLGLGHIQALVSPDCYAAALAQFPSVLWKPWQGGTDQEILELLGAVDTVLLGPGWGQGDSDAKARFLELAIDRAQNLVLDADALNLMAQNLEHFRACLLRRSQNAYPAPVLTPHEGEYRRLFPYEEEGLGTSRLERAVWSAQELQSVVLLKGYASLCAAPIQSGRPQQPSCYINCTGGPSLARAGTGDLLAGLLLALLARNRQPYQAAVQAAQIHGLLGDLATRRCGLLSCPPERLLDYLPELLQEIGWC